MKLLLKFTIILASCAILSACNTSGANFGAGSKEPLSSKIDRSKIGGYRYKNGEYICGPSTGCKGVRKVAYQAQSMTKKQLSQFKLLSTQPEHARGAISMGFAQTSMGSRDRNKLDGAPERVKIAGLKGMGFYVKSLNNRPRYAYTILIPGNAKLHHFIGVSKSKAAAKSAALKIANAWQPY
ncbi:MAG: hypothetical protein COC00_002850 [Rhizobiales bacterium]|nr:hypothetical protein [Hyphomicrobiales bacterium]